MCECDHLLGMAEKLVPVAMFWSPVLWINQQVAMT